jgi:hypothetical protein
VCRGCERRREDEGQIGAKNETAEAQERPGVIELHYLYGVSGALISGFGAKFRNGNRLAFRAVSKQLLF